MHIYVCVSVCPCVYIYICMCMCVCVCVCVCVYKNVSMLKADRVTNMDSSGISSRLDSYVVNKNNKFHIVVCEIRE